MPASGARAPCAPSTSSSKRAPSRIRACGTSPCTAHPAGKEGERRDEPLRRVVLQLPVAELAAPTEPDRPRAHTANGQRDVNTVLAPVPTRTGQLALLLVKVVSSCSSAPYKSAPYKSAPYKRPPTSKRPDNRYPPSVCAARARKRSPRARPGWTYPRISPRSHRPPWPTPGSTGPGVRSCGWGH